MTKLTLPAIAATFFFLLPCAAIAEESPEGVYGKYHQALLAGNTKKVKAVLPQSYDIWGKDDSADGKSLTLRATGKRTNLPGEKPETMSGVILMRKEGGNWKVEKADWQGTNQRDLPDSVKPTAAATPTAPDRVLGAAREPCVYKPVMTSEDMERCR